MSLPVIAVLFLLLLIVVFISIMFMGLFRKGPFDYDGVEEPYTEQGVSEDSPDANVPTTPRYGIWNYMTEDYERENARSEQ